MNLGRLGATIGRNKAVLGVAGAAIVAALAWRSRSAKASTSAAPGASTGLASYGAGYQTSAATGYDSTASDVYNAIQPQIEYLQRMWEEQQANTPPTPVPAEPEYEAGYYRRAGTNSIYRRTAAGELDWIDASEYPALGAPAFTTVPADDRLWSAPLLGADHPTRPLR